MAKARSSTRKVRASHCAKLMRVKCVRTKNCKMSDGKKRHFCRVKTNRKRQSGGKRAKRSHRTHRRSRTHRRRRRRSRRGGLGVASALSTAVLPFGLLWAQRAYKGKKGKSLRKMYKN